MHRGSRGKSRGWCWWHELFRGSRRRRRSRDFFWFFPPSFFVITLLAFGFFFFSFFSFSLLLFFPYSFFSIYHSIGSSLLVSRRVGFDASGKDRVMQRMRIVRWFEYLSLRFFSLPPFSFRLSMRREMCADVCDREESVVLITFRGKCPLPSFNLSFYLLLGFLSMVFLRKKIPSPLSSFSFLYRDINYRSLIK